MGSKEDIKPSNIWADYGDDRFFQWAVKGRILGRNADLAMLRYIHQNPHIINQQRGWNSASALMIAAENSNIEVVEYLISKGAELDLQNTNGNTALILAASAGNLEVVHVLDGNGAKVSIANSKGHTAVILATEHGHLAVVQWLLTRYPEQIIVTNSYGKNAVIVASEFGRPDIVRWLREEFSDRYLLRDAVLAQTGRGITALMFAAKYKDASILTYLLELQADATVVSKGKDTCLMWAAAAGKVDAVNCLLDLPDDERPDVGNKTDEGDTALTRAAENGHMEVIRSLIDHDNYEPIEFIVAMKKAWHQGHVEVATAFMEMLEILDVSVTKVFEDFVVLDLGRQYSSDSYTKSLESLSFLAGIYDFHFQLFLRFIPMFTSPAAVLNKLLPIFYKSLSLHCKIKDVNLVYKLVQLMATIRETARIHPLQKIDLGLRIEAIVHMLNECIQSDCMDDEETVQKMLCCSVDADNDYQFLVRHVEWAQAFKVGPLVTSLEYKESALFCTGHVSTYVDSIFWGFLRHAKPTSNLKMKLLTPFSNSKLFQFMFRQFDHNLSNFKTFQSNAIYFRYCPAMMFFGEGFSRFIMLLMVSKISLALREFHTANARSPMLTTATAIWLFASVIYEYGQICPNTMSVIPSYQKIRGYLRDGWSYYSMFGLILLFVWFAVNYLRPEDQNTWDISLGAIACSALFFIVGMLRYLSLLESVGKLIIMLQAMTEELLVFAIVYIICLGGFCVTLYCIMQQAEGFSTPSDTVLTIFAASLGNFDSTFRDLATGNTYWTIAILIEVFFIIATAVVLLNLIIARMSAVHERINVNSFQHWQFNRALRTKKFLLLEEKHPFCMLPAPLNLIPSLFLGLHLWSLWNAQSGTVNRGSNTRHKSALYKEEGMYYDGWNSLDDEDALNIPTPDISRSSKLNAVDDKNKTEGALILAISVCGTVADKLIGVIMAFAAPLFESAKVVRLILRRTFSFRRYLRQLLSLLILLVVSYPVFVFFLLWEVLLDVTEVGVQLDEGLECVSVDLRFPKQKRFMHVKEGAYHAVGKADHIQIQVLRAELAHAGPFVNPVVKIRLGNLQAQTTECIRNAGGVAGTYVWSKQVYCFPIDLHLLESYQLQFEVVDTGNNRKSAERTIGNFTNEKFNELYSPSQGKDYTHFSLKDCIANKSFEGRLLLDGDHQPPAALQVVIIANVRNFLGDYKPKNNLKKSGTIVASRVDYSKSFLEHHVNDSYDLQKNIFTPDDIKRIFSVVPRKRSAAGVLSQISFNKSHIGQAPAPLVVQTAPEPTQTDEVNAEGGEGGDGINLTPPQTPKAVSFNSFKRSGSGDTSGATPTVTEPMNSNHIPGPFSPRNTPRDGFESNTFSPNRRFLSHSVISKSLHENKQMEGAKTKGIEVVKTKSRRR